MRVALRRAAVLLAGSAILLATAGVAAADDEIAIGHPRVVGDG